MGCSGPWVRGSRRGGAVRRGLQELAGDGRVLDGGGVVDAEHGGEVQRVGAAGEGFLELPVDAHIPHDYIAHERLRLEAYRKIAAAADSAAANTWSTASWLSSTVSPSGTVTTATYVSKLLAP